jgi:hypothetical protein
MKYETEVHCPVCDKLLGTIAHNVKEFDCTEEVMLLRCKHEEDSPGCPHNPKWRRGMQCQVYEIERIPVKLDFPLLAPPFKGHL